MKHNAVDGGFVSESIVSAAVEAQIYSSRTDAFFVSRRGGDVLVWSRRHRRAVVLTEAEWRLLACLLESTSADDFTDLISVQTLASSGMSNSEFRRSLQQFVLRMTTLGLYSTPEQPGGQGEPVASQPKPVRLHGLYLHIASRCNLRCQYCYNANYRARFEQSPDTDLTENEWFHVISQASDLGVTCFNLTGGEPTLNPSCLAIGHHIRNQPGGYSELLTNGTRLDHFDPTTLLAAFSSIVVSLDSDDPAIHDRMRGAATHAHIVKNLDRLCRISPDNIALRPVLHRHNIAYLARYVEWARNRFGIRRIRATLYTPYSGDLDNERQFILNPQEYLALLEVYQRDLKSDQAVVDIDELVVANGCGAGSSILSIGANGAVFPCQAFHQSELVAGNVRHQALAEIAATSPVLRKLRCFQPADVEECRDCPLASICGNGCAAATYAVCGSYLKRNHLLCDLYARRCEHQLWKEYDKTVTHGT